MAAVKDLKPNIRPVTPQDIDFLGRMLFEAFFWRSDQPRPNFSEFHETNQEFQKLLVDWGRPGDAGVIAELGVEPKGAAWYRLWTDDLHSYGYVDPETPEIGIAVLPGSRRQGLGRKLLRALLDTAARGGFAQISLSVELDNPALHLYTSEGFVKVGRVEGSWTMLRQFAGTPR